MCLCNCIFVRVVRSDAAEDIPKPSEFVPVPPRTEARKSNLAAKQESGPKKLADVAIPIWSPKKKESPKQSTPGGKGKRGGGKKVKVKTEKLKAGTPTTRSKGAAARTKHSPEFLSSLVLSNPSWVTTGEANPRCELVADGTLPDGGVVQRIHVKTASKAGCGVGFEAKVIELSNKIEAGGKTRATLLESF